MVRWGARSSPDDPVSRATDEAAAAERNRQAEEKRQEQQARLPKYPFRFSKERDVRVEDTAYGSSNPTPAQIADAAAKRGKATDMESRRREDAAKRKEKRLTGGG